VHYNGIKLQNFIVQNFCTKGGQSLLYLLGTRENNFFFHFKCYNLIIRVVNFFETFCKCSPSSLGQDSTVKIEIFINFFLFGLLELENCRFEHFFEKNDLRPLGVNE
jgi:hypothetical protein